jgi:hypothetical protein
VACALAAVLMLGGCGGGGDDASSGPSTASTPTAAKKQKAKGTADRGARRCTKSALLASLLADVAPVPYKVDKVRCTARFARSRFVLASCTAGQTTVACGSPQVAAWRLGEKRWRLIAYADGLSCAEVRKQAADFPSSLCD